MKSITFLGKYYAFAEMGLMNDWDWEQEENEKFCRLTLLTLDNYKMKIQEGSDWLHSHFLDHQVFSLLPIIWWLPDPEATLKHADIPNFPILTPESSTSSPSLQFPPH